MALPSVFAYLDYRSFLRDWFDARKRADGGYSYAAFAAEGGCSKSALANVLSGARSPRADTLDAFARAIEMTPSQRNYLGLLVDLSMAEHERESTVFRYLENWWVPAIRELACLPSFRADPEWIAEVLCSAISAKQAQAALDTLFDLDFLHRLPDGTVEPRQVQFRSEPETSQAAVMHFHRTVISGLLSRMKGGEEAAREQHVVAAPITLPEELIPEAKARLNAVVNQLAATADASGVAGEQRVYQVAVQLLPLSGVVG